MSAWMQDQIETIRQRQELRSLLNAWDPAGLVEGDEPLVDQYDQLIDQILARLRAGQVAGQLTAFLARQLYAYGGQGVTVTAIHLWSERIANWWQSKRRLTAEDAEERRGKKEEEENTL